MDSSQSTNNNDETSGNDILKNVDSYDLHKETDHFKIYCFETDKDCLNDLSNGLEAAYEKVTKDLDCQLDYKVDVTVYPDIKSFHAAIGYAGGDVADNYISAAAMGKHIHLTSPLNPGPVRTYEHMTKSSPLHEFTHVVINDITSSSLFPMNVPRWLNEGIASYEGGPPMPMDILSSNVSSRVKSEQIPTFSDMASYGRDFITSGGYYFTLPVGTFFVEKYGFGKVKQLILSPDDFEGILGKSEEEVWNEWVEFLRSNY